MNSHECPAPEVVKCCTECSGVKPLSEFYRSKKRKDGSQTYFAKCAACVKAADKRRYARSRETVLARQKQYRQLNADKVKAYMQTYYLDNKDRILRLTKEYQSRPERKLADSERQARRYAERRDEIRKNQNALRDTPDGRKKAREQYRKHYERNTLKYIVKGGERRATRVKATPAWYKRGDAAPFYALARELTEKTGIQHVVDHIIPLRGKNVCGLHVKENLQVIPAKENLRKHNHYAG